MDVNAHARSVDSAATDVGDVQSKREPRNLRDPADADQGSRWRTFFPPHS
jgi:hypothetical protein